MTTQSALVTAPIPFKASMFIKMLERLDCGRLNLTLPNEETLVFRGKQTGIEAHLHIKKVIEISRQKNFRHIELETQNTNVPAIEFYKKQGFEITGMNMTIYDPYENKDEVALFMVYELMKN